MGSDPVPVASPAPLKSLSRYKEEKNRQEYNRKKLIEKVEARSQRLLDSSGNAADSSSNSCGNCGGPGGCQHCGNSGRCLSCMGLSNDCHFCGGVGFCSTCKGSRCSNCRGQKIHHAQVSHQHQHSRQGPHHYGGQSTHLDRHLASRGGAGGHGAIGSSHGRSDGGSHERQSARSRFFADTVGGAHGAIGSSRGAAGGGSHSGHSARSRFFGDTVGGAHGAAGGGSQSGHSARSRFFGDTVGGAHGAAGGGSHVGQSARDRFFADTVGGGQHRDIGDLGMGGLGLGSGAQTSEAASSRWGDAILGGGVGEHVVLGGGELSEGGHHSRFFGGGHSASADYGRAPPLPSRDAWDSVAPHRSASAPMEKLPTPKTFKQGIRKVMETNRSLDDLYEPQIAKLIRRQSKHTARLKRDALGEEHRHGRRQSTSRSYDPAQYSDSGIRRSSKVAESGYFRPRTGGQSMSYEPEYSRTRDPAGHKPRPDALTPYEGPLSPVFLNKPQRSLKGDPTMPEKHPKRYQCALDAVLKKQMVQERRKQKAAAPEADKPQIRRPLASEFWGEHRYDEDEEDMVEYMVAKLVEYIAVQRMMHNMPPECKEDMERTAKVLMRKPALHPSVLNLLKNVFWFWHLNKEVRRLQVRGKNTDPKKHVQMASSVRSIRELREVISQIDQNITEEYDMKESVKKRIDFHLYKRLKREWNELVERWMHVAQD